MERLIVSHAQLFNLVAQSQLFSLQFQKLKTIRGGMMLRIFELLFKRLVAAFQFNEMIMQRHKANPSHKIAVDALKSGTKPNSCKQKEVTQVAKCITSGEACTTHSLPHRATLRETICIRNRNAVSSSGLHLQERHAHYGVAA
jgi:hypothetical protein